MTAIARRSVNEPHELGRSIEDEKRVYQAEWHFSVTTSFALIAPIADPARITRRPSRAWTAWTTSVQLIESMSRASVMESSSAVGAKVDALWPSSLRAPG
jgi:hypothetical protein